MACCITYMYCTKQWVTRSMFCVLHNSSSISACPVSIWWSCEYCPPLTATHLRGQIRFSWSTAGMMPLGSQQNKQTMNKIKPKPLTHLPFIAYHRENQGESPNKHTVVRITENLDQVMDDGWWYRQSPFSCPAFWARVSYVGCKHLAHHWPQLYRRHLNDTNPCWLTGLLHACGSLELGSLHTQGALFRDSMSHQHRVLNGNWVNQLYSVKWQRGEMF